MSELDVSVDSCEYVNISVVDPRDGMFCAVCVGEVALVGCPDLEDTTKDVNGVVASNCDLVEGFVNFVDSILFAVVSSSDTN